MGFHQDIDTAERAIEMAKPLLSSWLREGHQLIWTDQAREVEFWQRSLGDVVIPMSDGSVVSAEIKGEKVFTGNLFIETWSNRDFGRGRDGWIFTSRADVLVMVYLDIERAYVIPLRKLWAWCIELGNLYRYAEKEVGQSRNGIQKNKTVGAPIPISHFPREIGIREFSLKVAAKQTMTPQHRAELLAMGCVEPGTEEPIDF